MTTLFWIIITLFVTAVLLMALIFYSFFSRKLAGINKASIAIISELKQDKQFEVNKLRIATDKIGSLEEANSAKSKRIETLEKGNEDLANVVLDYNKRYNEGYFSAYERGYGNALRDMRAAKSEDVLYEKMPQKKNLEEAEENPLTKA